MGKFAFMNHFYIAYRSCAVSISVESWRGHAGDAARAAFARDLRELGASGDMLDFEELKRIIADEPGVKITYTTIGEVNVATSDVPKRAPRIAMPPGATAVRVLRHVVTPRFFRLHVQVVVSEMQAEYIEHLAAGRLAAARFAAIRGHLMLIAPVVRALIPSAIRKLL